MRTLTCGARHREQMTSLSVDRRSGEAQTPRTSSLSGSEPCPFGWFPSLRVVPDAGHTARRQRAPPLLHSSRQAPRAAVAGVIPPRGGGSEEAMPLNAEARALLDQMQSSGVPPLHTLSVEAARQLLLDLFATKGDREPVGKVVDRQVPGAAGPIPVPIYTPTGAGPFPILVYFHGGGWTIGNLETHDAPCRTLTNSAGCVVVSVDYRLAPEHKYPAAPDDCYAATRWVADYAAEIGGDPGALPWAATAREAISPRSFPRPPGTGAARP
jgi:alpha/beta hydrolase fold